jgi:hypothetical protein
VQGRRRGRAQGREGGGRGRGREEKGGEGSSPRGSNSVDHRLQNLGHHGEREMWEREVAAREKSNERKGPGGAHGEQGAPGARGPSWAGPGWAGPHRGSKPRDTHNHRSEINSRSKIQNRTKQHTRLNTTSDKEI